MQKIITSLLICFQLTGCFAKVIHVDQVRASKIITLAGKKIEMDKPGCYIDAGHGRICTGSSYDINKDSQWEVIDEDVNEAENKNTQIADSKTMETVGEILGTVAVFALIFAGAYYGAKGAYHPPLITPTIRGDVTPTQAATINQSNVIQNQNSISSTGGDTYKIERTATGSGDIQIRPSLNSDPSKVYRGSINQFGGVQLRNYNGDILRGNIDNSGYGRLIDQNGNTIPVRPN